jgi:hypothetical protein
MLLWGLLVVEDEECISSCCLALLGVNKRWCDETRKLLIFEANCRMRDSHVHESCMTFISYQKDSCI